MKVKRYTAPSMKAALALVRAEQGADAVILSSRRAEEGIEVIAAVDYDEGLFLDMSRTRAAAPELPPHPESARTPVRAESSGRGDSPGHWDSTARGDSARSSFASAFEEDIRAAARLAESMQGHGYRSSAVGGPLNFTAAARDAATAHAERAALRAPVEQPAVTKARAAPPIDASPPMARPAMPPRPAPASAGASRAASDRSAVSASAAAPGRPASTRASASAAARVPAASGPPAAAPRLMRPSASATAGAPAARGHAQAPGPMPSSASPSAQGAPLTPARTSAGGSKPAVSASVDPGIQAMQRQLGDLQRLLQTGLADMTWNDRRLREPLKAHVLEKLSALDIAPDVALSLANLAPKRTNAADPSRIPLALLVKYLPIAEDLTDLSSGVIALVGPTGAGKTTTIAKLAARWSMRYGSDQVVLVSTDAYRIGARDQLMTYARILDVPMHAPNSGRELGRLLERLSNKKLVLIDTAGMGPRDVRLTEQIAALKLGAARARVLLTLPAQGEAHMLDEIVRAFAAAAPVGSIITKLDEAASLGSVISVIVRHRLKIAYVCDGQRVPDDFHEANPRRVWLARSALRLKEGKASPHDPAYFSRHFGVPAHA